MRRFRVANGGLDALGGGRNRSNAQIAAAAQSGLRLDRTDRDSPVKLDGSLREWPARSAARKVVSGDASKTAFAVGLMLTTFGTFWGSEGAGAHWPGGDAAILVVLAVYTAFAFAAVAMLRARVIRFPRPLGPVA